MLDVRSGVRGRLHAEFVAANGTTNAVIVDASPPLEMRGPFAQGGVPRFFLRNVSCGVFADDAYDVRLRARDGARAHVRATPATKVHAMPNGAATSVICIESAPNAALAYYDGPTILQRGADLAQRVEIRAAGGLAIYAEVLVLGRMARGETLEFRRYRSELVVRGEDERVLYSEQYELRPPEARTSIAAASPPVLGKIILAGAAAEASLAALELSAGGMLAGYDRLPAGGGIVLRAAGDQLEPVSQLIEGAVLAMTEERSRRSSVATAT